VYLNPG
jgi:hypothetical protein